MSIENVTVGENENGGADGGGHYTRIVHETDANGRVLSVAIDVLSPFCGDGIVQQEYAEECDDGNEMDTDECRNTCLLPRCGDGVLSDGEECEDGNTFSDDGCSSVCRPDKATRVKAVVIDLPISPLTGTVTNTPGTIQTPGGNRDNPMVRQAATSHAPAGETGPASIGIMAAGAAAGWAWVRRRRLLQKDSSAA